MGEPIRELQRQLNIWIDNDPKYSFDALDIDGMFAVIGAPGANRSSDFNDFELGSAYIYKKGSRTEEPWSIEKKLDLLLH